MSDASDAFEEAVKRIETADQEGAETLDLSDLIYLEEIPWEIGALKSLETLRISKGTFPSKISGIYITGQVRDALSFGNKIFIARNNASIVVLE